MHAKGGPPRRRRGRPRIVDYLQLYLYVEVGRRRLSLSVRAFCSRRATRFEGSFATWVKGRTAIRGEALRRRYREARKALGLFEEHHPHVRHEHNLLAEIANETLEQMIEDLLSAN